MLEGYAVTEAALTEIEAMFSAANTYGVEAVVQLQLPDPKWVVAFGRTNAGWGLFTTDKDSVSQRALRRRPSDVKFAERIEIFSSTNLMRLLQTLRENNKVRAGQVADYARDLELFCRMATTEEAPRETAE